MERSEDERREIRRRAAMLRIRQWGDPVLRSPAREVEDFDAAFARETAEMTALMDGAAGSGLAGPQVGTLRRVFVYRAEPGAEARVMANPVLEWRSDETEVELEGCLSLQGVAVEVERARQVRMRAQDAAGAAVVVEAEGPHARVLQHELDHLDGVLILDRTTKEQRREAVRALREGRAMTIETPEER